MSWPLTTTERGYACVGDCEGPLTSGLPKEGPGYKGQRDSDLTHIALCCLCNQRQVTAVL